METAVEWLVGQLKKIEYNPLEKNGYSNAKEKLFEKSKQMEKQQIIDAYYGEAKSTEILDA